jgi:hypothetical protein
VATRHTAPSFWEFYLDAFKHDMPVYITADVLLHSVHRSYDAMLQRAEVSTLSKKLGALLDATHAKVKATSDASLANARADLDVFLSVARILLDPARSDVARSAAIDAVVQAANAATGAVTLSLFGGQKSIDSSMFKPRGHYAGIPALEQYFRTFIWLGRTEFRLTILPEDDPAMIDRETVAALLLAELTADSAELAAIDRVLSALIGVSDNADSKQLVSFARTAGIASAAAAAAANATSLAMFRDKLMASDVGVQRILSQLLEFPADGSDIKPPRAYLVLGQRFTVDSNAVGSVVSSARLMPNEMDVLYSVLRNDAILPSMKSELDSVAGYGGLLAFARRVIDASPAAQWSNSTLYNAWLGALRELSAPSDAAAFAALPARFKSAPYWIQKMNTQLTSFAELRRNNVLYVKESFTGSLGCDFPSVLVEPIPQFWRALQSFARIGREQIVPVLESDQQLALYFNRLDAAAARLEALANKHLAKQELTMDDLAWVNTMVVEKVVDNVCAKETVRSGWLQELYLAEDSTARDKVTTSIHTQPTDEAGNEVGRVLHIGTDNVEAVLVVADDCSGKPTLHVGASQSFKTLITEDFNRLNDAEWTDKYVAMAQRPAFLQPGYAAASGGKLWTEKCAPGGSSSTNAAPTDSSSSSSWLLSWTLMIAIAFLN